MLSSFSQAINGSLEATNTDDTSNKTLDDFSSLGSENLPLAKMIEKFSSLHKGVRELNLISIHFWLWNIRSLNDNKFNYINYLLSGRAFNEFYPPEVIALTETWMRTSGKFKTFNITSYTHYSVSRNSRRGGGVSVHVKNSLNSQLITSFVNDDLELIHLKLTLSSNNALQIIAIYRPPNGSVDEFFKTLDTIFAKCDGYKLIIGDINLSEHGTNSNFFTSYNDLINSYGYKRVNNGITYFHDRSNNTDQNGGTILDHVISDESLCNYALTSLKTPYSDHNIVMGSTITNFKCETDNKVTRHPLIKLNKNSALKAINNSFNPPYIPGNNINERTNKQLSASVE